MSEAKDWRPEYFNNLVEYLANCADQRTIKQFAADNNISESTVYDYKRLHSAELWKVVDNVRPQYVSQIRSAAMQAVFANIKSSFNDRKLALQLIGDLVERTENTTTIRTPEEKRARVEELLSRLQGKKSANLSAINSKIEQDKSLPDNH